MIIFILFLFFIGLVKDGSKTLRELNVANGIKMMVVGSTINDVMKVTPPPPGALKEEKTTSGRVGWDGTFCLVLEMKGGQKTNFQACPFGKL